MNTQLVISINIYKSLPTLMKQLQTIQEFVSCDYVVVLNCNGCMYTILKYITLPPNVYINPDVIEKTPYHGSITQGIVSNMQFAMSQFQFNYFLVLSSRTIFYKSLNMENLDRIQAKRTSGPFRPVGWHWPIFKHTLLAKHYLEKRCVLHCSAHEGLCFRSCAVQAILSFLQKNPVIRTDLFTFRYCVEEFALQTIASNEVEDGFMDLGNGVSEQITSPAEHTCLRKIPFVY